MQLLTEDNDILDPGILHCSGQSLVLSRLATMKNTGRESKCYNVMILFQKIVILHYKSFK